MSGAPGAGLGALAFLAFAGILLPMAATAFARGEARAERAGDGGLPAALGVSRLALYANALVTHAVLLGATVAAARIEGVALFAPAALDWRDLAAATATLAAALGLGELFWRSRSPAERDRLWVLRILPRTAAERRAWVLVSAGAAIAEEVAYRGAFVLFATVATGSLPVAVVASALAFAAVHAPQGAVSVAYVFVLALLHQAVVLFTETLVLAIAVHFAYDVVAGLWLGPRGSGRRQEGTGER